MAGSPTFKKNHHISQYDWHIKEAELSDHQEAVKNRTTNKKELKKNFFGDFLLFPIDNDNDFTILINSVGKKMERFFGQIRFCFLRLKKVPKTTKLGGGDTFICTGALWLIQLGDLAPRFPGGEGA